MNAHLQSLLARLKQENTKFRLIELTDRAMTVADVIKFSKGDVKAEEICKTIVVRDGQGNYCGLFLEGSRKVDFAKVASLLGSKAKIASADEVKSVTRIEPGAVCPLLLKIPVIVDKGILKFDNVNVGSGDHLYGIEMSPKDMLGLIDARVENISV